jgi:hypothetical protein
VVISRPHLPPTGSPIPKTKIFTPPPGYSLLQPKSLKAWGRGRHIALPSRKPGKSCLQYPLRWLTSVTHCHTIRCTNHAQISQHQQRKTSLVESWTCHSCVFGQVIIILPETLFLLPLGALPVSNRTRHCGRGVGKRNIPTFFVVSKPPPSDLQRGM